MRHNTITLLSFKKNVTICSPLKVCLDIGHDHSARVGCRKCRSQSKHAIVLVDHPRFHRICMQCGEIDPALASMCRGDPILPQSLFFGFRRESCLAMRSLVPRPNPALPECPHCGLRVSRLWEPECGELLLLEPEFGELLSDSAHYPDYAEACARCMEGLSIAAKQRVTVSFRLCLPSLWETKISSRVMSFLFMSGGIYKVRHRRYLLQTLLIGHAYTYNDIYNCRQAMETQMKTPTYRGGSHGSRFRMYFSRCAVFSDCHNDLITYIVSFIC